MNSFLSGFSQLGKLVGIEEPIGVAIFFGISLLFIYFLGWFLRPALAAWRTLDKTKIQLRGFSSQPTPDALGKVFSGDEKLRQQWRQYAESLHQQQQEKSGVLQSGAWRATLPAEAFFNSQNIVDGRVNVEFFRHLPGILTGIGIIGTFAGLIHGLEGFNVSDGGPEQVKKSLDGLMGSVKNAFWVSAGAIFVAMVITGLEKFFLAQLYSRVEWIAGAIDTFFEGGAGEEYLSRLVRASEDSASQSKILKDALVKDLGDLLKNLTATQLNASNKLNQELIGQIKESAEEQRKAAQENAGVMSSAIAGSIRQSLEGPLQHIAQSVQSASRDQTASAAQMLGDVMAGFSERLNSLFGEQINGINELNRQTAQEMQGATESLQALIIRLEESSLRSANAMSIQTTQAIAAMSDGLSGIQDRVLENNRAREEAMNARTHELISEMSNRVGVAMREVSSTTTGALNELTVNLKNSQARTLKDAKTREEQMVQKTQEMVSALAEQVGVVVDRLSATTTGSLQSLVSNFEAVGQRSAQEMSNRLAASMEAMEARQNSMNSQAAGFVDQIGKLIASSQSQTHQQLTGTLAALGEETSGLLNGLRKAQTDVVAQQDVRERTMLDRVEKLVGEMTRMVDKVVHASNDATQKMAHGISQLSSVSTKAISGMNAGAEQVNLSADKFAEAGKGVAGVITQAATISSRMDSASRSLSDGAKSLTAELQDYQSRRHEMAQLQREVCEIAEKTRREVDLTADALQRIGKSVSGIQDAQGKIDKYIDGVSDVLKKSSEKFYDAVTNAIDRVNNKFHADLERSVNSLSGGIDHLQLVLDDLPSVSGRKI